MKFVISVVLIALLSFVGCLYFPWWSIAIMAFIAGIFIPQKPAMAFLSGFVAVFLLWIVLSYWISVANEHVLAHKMSMIILKMDNVAILILATGLIGGLVAGFAALAGSCLQKNK
jgi:hypothetical protein